MQEDIDNIMRRTRRYWYKDGFAEIGAGLLLGLVGIGLYLQKLVAGNPIWLIAVILGLMAFVIGSSLIIKRFVVYLKQRVTYPRTGYIEYDHKRDRTSRWPVAAFVLVLAVLTMVIPDLFRRMGVVVGLWTGAILGYLAYRSAIPRLSSAAAIAIAAGILSGYLELGDIAATALVFGVVGLTLLIAGTLALIAYLRQTRPPGEVA